MTTTTTTTPTTLTVITKHPSITQLAPIRVSFFSIQDLHGCLFITNIHYTNTTNTHYSNQSIRYRWSDWASVILLLICVPRETQHTRIHTKMYGKMCTCVYCDSHAHKNQAVEGKKDAQRRFSRKAFQDFSCLKFIVAVPPHSNCDNDRSYHHQHQLIFHQTTIILSIDRSIALARSLTDLRYACMHACLCAALCVSLCIHRAVFPSSIRESEWVKRDRDRARPIIRSCRLSSAQLRLGADRAYGGRARRQRSD